MPTSWNDMSVANLRDIARSYRNLHSLGNISKQTKATLIETLSKVMEWNDGDIYTKKEHGGKFVGAYDEDDKQVGLTNLKRPQPENKKKEAQPKKAEKDDNAMMEKDAKKKSVKKAISQAKSASEDAKAIAPPSQKQVEKMTLAKQLGKAKTQAKSASEDAKAIVPPKMEEEPAVKSRQKEVSEKDMIANIENSHSTKLRKRITQISEEVGVKIPRGALTQYMYGENLRKGTCPQFGMSLKGQNTGREDLSTDRMLKVALSHMGDKRKEFLTKLFNLIFVKK